MAYLYRHIRKDKDQVFYVGIGTDNKGKYLRAKSKNRNRYWHRIVKNTEYEIEIMFDDITFEQAIEKEKQFIQIYGRRDLGLGTLCNLTDGGEGVVNMSEEGKKKLRELRKNIKMSNEQKQKYSEMFKGSGNPNSSKIINKKTLEVYGSILEASEKNNINKHTLRNNLNGKNCNHTDFFYYKDYLEKGIEQLEKERLEKIEFTKQEFKRKKAEKVISEETRMKLSNYRKGKTPSAKSIEKLKERNRAENNHMSKRIINIKTKEIYNSIREAAERNGHTYGKLKNIIQGKTKTNNTNLIKLIDYNKKEGFPPLS